MAATYISINLNAAGGSDDKRVKVSTDDSAADFLEGKIEAGSAKVLVSTELPGGNETLLIDLDEAEIDHNSLLNYDVNQHRVLDDASTTTDSVWSSSKIQTELDTKINVATPMTDNKLVKSVGTSGAVVEATGINVDDLNNVTGINNLIVDGNLTVNGTTTSVNSSTLDVTDANILVNNGGDQASADLGNAGITIEMSDAINVELGYDSTTASKMTLGELGSQAEIVTVNHTQMLSNKSLDADNNTITNIELSNLKAGVLQTDISGAVSDTNLASSKAVKDHITSQLALQDDASEITYTPDTVTNWTGDVNPGNTNDALDQLADRLETSSGTLSTHLDGGLAKHTASSILNVASGNLVATDVQAALNELQTELDNRPTVTETLQNKTLDSTNVISGSIENPIRSDVKKDTEANLVTYALTATDGQFVFATDTKKAFQVIDNLLEPIGGGGAGASFELTKVAHGFSLLDSVYTLAGTYEKALADNAETLGTHVVVEVVDVDTVILAQVGRFEVPSHGLSLGDYYYTSDSTAGLLTATEPSIYSNPLLLADTSNTVVILPFRPSFIDNTSVSQQVDDIVNNSTSNVAGFVLNNSVTRAAKANVVIEVDATVDEYETYDIDFLFNGSSWDISYDSLGNSDITLDISVAGQVNYTCPNIAGFVSGKISFKYDITKKEL